MSSSITDSLLGMIGGQVMEQLGGQIGADSSTTQKAVSAALPLLIGAIGKNASTQDGASALLKALMKDHDGSVMKDLGGFISGGGNRQDGSGILGHVLGEKRQVVEKSVSKSVGLDSGQMGKLLEILAPVVMGAIGKQQRDGGLDVGSLMKVLSGERKQAESQLGGLARVLDFNKDGSILDDILGFIMRFLGKR